MARELKINNFDINKFLVWRDSKPCGVIIDATSLKSLRKIKNKYLNLCYLYHSTRDRTQNISWRLLSAWKYFEEFVALHDMVCQPYEIPKKIYSEIYDIKNIDLIRTSGINKENKSILVFVKKYNQQFLNEFRKEIRLLIAHHKRNENKYHSEKLYIPNQNINYDLRMERNLGGIIELMNCINSRHFNFFKEPNIPKDIKIIKKTQKMNFLKKL